MFEKIEKLKNIDNIFVIGHNNLDFDSYFSSYILSKILQSLNINAKFAIIDDYNISNQDKEIINDYKKEEPIILKKEKVEQSNFILVDHNDIDQSLKNDKCNILIAIDHHIDSKKVKDCYTVEYTSTLLYIYDMFKNIYNFSNEEKELIALSVMTDSEYLTSTRFKESDKKIYDELKVKLDPIEIRNKYFKTTDFDLDINFNLKNNYKSYNIDNININRVILKCNNEDRKYINKYLNEFSKLYKNTLFIWNEYDSLKTLVYYNCNLVKEYDYILTSSVLIIKDLINNSVIKANNNHKKYN